mgnify:CR=1 FL=1
MKMTTHRLLFILITVVTFLLCAPLLVNVLFMYEAPCAVFEARFDSGDLLGYIGSAAVGAGSISLARIQLIRPRDLIRLIVICRANKISLNGKIQSVRFL